MFLHLGDKRQHVWCACQWTKAAWTSASCMNPSLPGWLDWPTCRGDRNGNSGG